MVKRGGTKKKISIEKIVKKASIAPTFTKRRDGFFSKASQLCLLSGAQIAILATPPSSESNVSFYSFGHSSVDDVVSAFLSGQRPVPVLEGNNKETREDVCVCLTRKDLGLGFWWEDESLNRSENPEELRHAIDSMWTVLKSVKELNSNVNNNDGRDHQAFVNDDDDDLKKKDKIDVVFDNETKEADETLILQSSTLSAICFNEKSEEDDNKNNALCESFCVTDNNNIGLPEGDLDYDQEIDIDQLIDFDTPFEISFDDFAFEDTAASLLTKTEAVDDDDHVSMDTTMMCSYFEGLKDEDDLHFSDYFNNLPTINNFPYL